MDKIVKEMQDDIRRKYNQELFELSVEFIKDKNMARWENYIHPFNPDNEAKVYWNVWQKEDKVHVYYGMSKYEMHFVTRLDLGELEFAERVFEMWKEGIKTGQKNTPEKK